MAKPKYRIEVNINGKCRTTEVQPGDMIDIFINDEKAADKLYHHFFYESVHRPLRFMNNKTNLPILVAEDGFETSSGRNR